MSKENWNTRTHAELRAAQGDRSGARRILRRILEQHPADRVARTMLEALAAAPSTEYREPQEVVPERRRAATARELKHEFVARLAGDGTCHTPRSMLRRLLRRLVRKNPQPQGETMQQILETLRREFAAAGTVALVANDGMIVLAAGESEREALGVHIAELMRNTRAAASEDDWGVIREWALETETHRFFWHRVDDSCGLVLTDTINAPEPGGHVRYRVSIAAAELGRSLSPDTAAGSV